MQEGNGKRLELPRTKFSDSSDVLCNMPAHFVFSKVVALLACSCWLIATQEVTAAGEIPADVKFSGPASSPIASTVAVPAGRAWFLTSGTVPPVADEKAPAGSPARYGDTKTQGIGALRQIEARLKEARLSLKDVVYLRVYVTADKSKEGKFDFPGWFEAYAQFFGTADNPVKPARSTVGVAALVNPDWLLEIEAVAVYPTPKPEVVPAANGASASLP